MRFLIVGASGLVGSHVAKAAIAAGHDVIGTYRSHESRHLRQLDLADLASANSLLREVKPDWVVHAAGWTWVDGCETDPVRAQAENCQQPVELARLCREVGARFAYVSTSYVFDGRAGPYGEDDSPNPLNVYAKSKWAAEQRIQDVLEGKGLIPRVICVWGEEQQQKNFVYQVLRSLKRGEPMKLPSDQIGNPTWAGDVGGWLVELAAAGKSGIWNLASSDANCTRVEWFCRIREAVKKYSLLPLSDAPGYDAISTEALKQLAPRPLHAGLRVEKIRSFSQRAPQSCDTENIVATIASWI